MKPRRRLPAETPEINLVPLLDMVSLLIQLLLVNAQFGVYAELASAVGRPTDSPLGGAQVVVEVGAQGFTLSWAEGAGRESLSLPCVDGRCAAPESYDAAGLNSALTALKGKFPSEDQAQLVPGAEVSFEVIAMAMDALRGPGEPLFPDVLFGGAL
jgi:biopolymer transport protein ExbD